MDETYQTYVNRVVPLTLPATYHTQLLNIQKSPKFQAGQAVPFPGFSAITPPAQDDDPENAAFYDNLKISQQQLLEQLDRGLLVPVPPESFHVTIADLIWDSNYREAIAQNPDFDRQIAKCIQESFQQYQAPAIKAVNRWQLLGLLVFPRALAVALVPEDEPSYQQILALRRTIYQNAHLIALGIEQQYYFTAHITLGYFGDVAADLDRDRLANLLASFNERWLATAPQILTIKQVQLRQFADMTAFNREPDWPVVDV